MVINDFVNIIGTPKMRNIKFNIVIAMFENPMRTQPPPLAQPLPNPLATNQTKIPYPKTLKHSNKIELRLNES